jgi:DOPA 4,5-dioxygenase
MISFFFVCLVAASISIACSHSTHYKLAPSVVKAYEQDGTLPPFLSYHIHVLFILGNNDSINTALALRSRFVEHFNLSQTANCTGLFHQGRLCMFEVGLTPDVEGPFVSGEWAVFLRLEDFPICKLA